MSHDDVFKRLHATHEDAKPYVNQFLQLWIANAQERTHAERLFEMKIFPAPNPVSLCRKDIQNIKRLNYMVSLKADGIRCILVLTRSIRNENISFIINRNHEVIFLRIFAEQCMFSDATMLDCELVRDEGDTMALLAFDIVCLGGDTDINATLSSKDYRTRLQVLDNIINGNKLQVCGDDELDLCIAKKECDEVSNACRMWASRNESRFKTDGLIFTPVDEGILSGTHTSMFKWKVTHTVDVEIRDDGEILLGTPDSFILFSTGAFRFEKTQWQLTLSTNAITQQVLASKRSTVVECTCDIIDDIHQIIFVPTKLRLDKATGNSIVTVLRTLDNIKERLAINELN